MNMKKGFLAIVVLILMAQDMSAQSQLSAEIQKVFDACLALRAAISTGNTTSLKSANEDFKKCKVKDFFSLCPQEFPSSNHQELVVITEPQGKISLRVHCKKTKKWYNDEEDVNDGRAYRQQIFDIPKGVKDTVEAEVINCGNNDISFVIITN